MRYIQAYDLATIVDQPRTGTNGNMNPFNILRDSGVTWTGVKVLKHYGSQFYSIGILPDIYVEKTNVGARAGKDVLLDKAVERIVTESAADRNYQ
jgi:C-terminal processing protease CtpA/Prc